MSRVMPRRVETERIVLRPWRKDDAASLLDALTESVDHLLPWIPWATDAPPTPDEVDARLRIWIDEFEDGVNFVYAMVERSGTRLIGGAGLYGRVGPGALEIGYWIRLHEAGRGFASEATRILTHTGFAQTDVGHLEIHTDALNVASRHIPEKLGYEMVSIRPDERPDGRTRDLVCYTMTRERYAALAMTPSD